MKLFKRKKDKKGFTLVEILTVLVIVSLLIVVAVPASQGISKRVNKRAYATKIELAKESAMLWAENNQSCFTCLKAECSTKCSNAVCQVDDESSDEKVCELKLGFLASENYFNYDNRLDKEIINPVNNEVINEETVTIIFNKKDGSITTSVDENDYVTLYFNGNGATSGYQSSITCKKNVECILPSNLFAKNKNEFSGWSLQAVGGVLYQPGETVKINKETTIYANWKPAKYELAFNANTGSGYMDSVICDHEEPCLIPNNSFTKENNTFNGWSLTSGGGASYTSGGNIIINKNTTLYAVWALKKYNLNFNGNTSTSGTMSPVKCEHDKACTISNNLFLKTGHTFAGWSTTSSGAVSYANNGSIKITSDMTLYAKWTPNTYSVTYNANGGSGGPANQTKTYGVNLSLSTAAPARTGYTFASWNTNASGTGNAYAPGANYTANAALALYAKWTPNKYTISFNANGGSGAPGAQTKTHDVILTLSAVQPTKTGYTFMGWNTNASGTGTTYASRASYNGNANATLYAKWEDKTLPTCGAQSPAVSTWTNGNRTISVSCSDSGSGCTASTFSKTFTTDTDTGEIEIKDKSGNIRKCPVSVKVDKTKPYTPKLYTEPDGLICLHNTLPTNIDCGNRNNGTQTTDVTCTITCPASSWIGTGQFTWWRSFSDPLVNGASSGGIRGEKLKSTVTYHYSDGSSSGSSLHRYGTSRNYVTDPAGNRSATLIVKWV